MITARQKVLAHLKKTRCRFCAGDCARVEHVRAECAASFVRVVFGWAGGCFGYSGQQP